MYLVDPRLPGTLRYMLEYAYNQQTWNLNESDIVYCIYIYIPYLCYDL